MFQPFLQVSLSDLITEALIDLHKENKVLTSQIATTAIFNEVRKRFDEVSVIFFFRF